MLQVLSITFHCHYHIWACMCSTGPFQFRWLKGYIHSSCYYHHQIGSINLAHYHIFPWLCAWDVISYSVTYYIYILAKPGFCFHFDCAVYDECKYSDTFWFAHRVCLIAHYTILLSSLCKHIWKHWTEKMPVRYILSSVWVRLGIFSQLSIMQYMGLCVFNSHISLNCDDWENMHFVLLSSSNRKYELLSIV